MVGDPDVLKLLNEQLTSELTAINCSAPKMQESWGFTEIAKTHPGRVDGGDGPRRADHRQDLCAARRPAQLSWDRFAACRQTLREQFVSDPAIETWSAGLCRVMPCAGKTGHDDGPTLFEEIPADEEQHMTI